MPTPPKSSSPAVRTVRNLIEGAKRKIAVISCREAERRLSADVPPVLIDVREEYEYELSHIGGSVHICRGTLEMEVEQEYGDRRTPLILYCSRGDRSALAGATLRQLGYRMLPIAAIRRNLDRSSWCLRSRFIALGHRLAGA